MCNRYTIAEPSKLESLEVAGRLLSEAFRNMAPRYNIAPSDFVPVVARDDAGEWQATSMRWGFVPHYDHSDKPERTPLNAKSETVLTLGMFRQAAQRRRCLLPADGFYEWHHVSATLKVPHYFYFRDRSPFFFAGIYETATGKQPPTCALLTTAPLATVAPFHTRSPLILNAAQADAWTAPGGMSVEDLAAIISVTRWGEELAQHVVTRAVGSTQKNRIDGPECIAPVLEEPDLFTLG